MAIVYKVCVDGFAVNATITMTSSATTLRTYTNAGGCTVRETTKVLTFTSSRASDLNFNVYYSYYVEYSTNFQSDGAPILQQGIATIPAGATSVTKEVPTYIRTDCDDNSGLGTGLN